jgi:hypothetical protein
MTAGSESAGLAAATARRRGRRVAEAAVAEQIGARPAGARPAHLAPVPGARAGPQDDAPYGIDQLVQSGMHQLHGDLRTGLRAAVCRRGVNR